MPGGAVVIFAGIISDAVIAALSSQKRGAENFGSLNPKPLLLIHTQSRNLIEI
jgi:hypothetical protein